MTSFDLKEHLSNWYYKIEEFFDIETEIKKRIADFVGVEYIASDSLPDEGETNAIYLIPVSEGVCAEYLYKPEVGGWEAIGQHDLDLSDLTSLEAFNSLKTDYEAHTHDTEYYTQEEMETDFLKVSSVNLELLEYARAGVRLQASVLCNDDTISAPAGLTVEFWLDGVNTDGDVGQTEHSKFQAVTDDTGTAEIIIGYDAFYTKTVVEKSVYATCKLSSENVALPTAWYVVEEDSTTETDTETASLVTASSTDTDETVQAVVSEVTDGLSWAKPLYGLASLNDVVAEDDVIFIDAGTYYLDGSPEIKLPMVSVFGDTDHTTYIIQSTASNSAFKIIASEDNTNTGIHNIEYLNFDKNFTTVGSDYLSITLYAVSVTVSYCSFYNNYKQYNGGALDIFYPMSGDVVVFECYFYNTRTSGYGHVGGSLNVITSRVDYLTVYNCTFNNPTKSSYNALTGYNGRAICIHNWGNSVTKGTLKAYCNTYVSQYDTNYGISESDCESGTLGCTWVTNLTEGLV